MEKVDKLARMRHSFTAKFISEHIPDGSRILEIGGNRLTPYWLQTKLKYDIVTVNLHDADYVLNVERDSLEKIGERFRYVTMFEVIEHLENPYAALRNICAIMEKGGLFLGSTPNRFDPYLFLGDDFCSEDIRGFIYVDIPRILGIPHESKDYGQSQT